MSIPATFRLHQMLADKPMTFSQLRSALGVGESTARGALSALISQGLVRRVGNAPRGFLYGLESQHENRPST